MYAFNTYYKRFVSLSIDKYYLITYFNIPFEETVRRHQTRSKSQEFGEEHMRQWWREKDFSSVLEEEIISCEMDAECIIEKIYTDLLKYI